MGSHAGVANTIRVKSINPNVPKPLQKKLLRKKLIMIMGVQRSGTTALFEALAGAPGVSPRHESPSDEIYDDYFLRPEPEIRSVLHALPGTVLLKPVRESERRTPLEVAVEYRDYDLRLVWLYRDPVNVYHSYVRLGWSGDSPDQASWFAAHWAKRNADALSALDSCQKQLLFVSYDDLTNDSNLTSALAKELSICSSMSLRRDFSGGRKVLPASMQKIIDLPTAPVRKALAAARSIRPHLLTPTKASIFERLQKWFGASFRQGHKQAKATSILQSAEYSDFLNAADSGLLYRRWHLEGVLRSFPETGSYIAIGYEACRLLHANSTPFATGKLYTWQTRAQIAELDAFLAAHRPRIRRQVEDEIVAALSTAKSNDVSSCLAKLSDRLTAIWLGLPEKEIEICVRTLGRMSPLRVSESAQEWECIRPTIESSGLVSDLLGAGLLQPAEVADFFRETCLPLKALQVILENTLFSLMDQSEIMERVRTHPKLVRSVINESLRLNPIFLSMKRRLVRDVEVCGVVFAQNSEVDLLVGAANRDPKIFSDADAFALDRNAPPPFLLENESVPFMRLDDEACPIFNHLVFDAAGIVIENLLVLSRTLRFRKGCYAKFQLSSGNCVQKLFGVSFKLDGGHV